MTFPKCGLKLFVVPRVLLRELPWCPGTGENSPPFDAEKCLILSVGIARDLEGSQLTAFFVVPVAVMVIDDDTLEYKLQPATYIVTFESMSRMASKF